jgi:hypothetical protein
VAEGFAVAMNWGKSRGAKEPELFRNPLAMMRGGASDKNARQSARRETEDIQKRKTEVVARCGVNAGEKTGAKVPPTGSIP